MSKVRIENVTDSYLAEGTNPNKTIEVKLSGGGVVELPPGDSFTFNVHTGFSLQIFAKGETVPLQDVFIP